MPVRVVLRGNGRIQQRTFHDDSKTPSAELATRDAQEFRANEPVLTFSQLHHPLEKVVREASAILKEPSCLCRGWQRFVHGLHVFPLCSLVLCSFLRELELRACAQLPLLHTIITNILLSLISDCQQEKHQKQHVMGEKHKLMLRVALPVLFWCRKPGSIRRRVERRSFRVPSSSQARPADKQVPFLNRPSSRPQPQMFSQSRGTPVNHQESATWPLARIHPGFKKKKTREVHPSHLMSQEDVALWAAEHEECHAVRHDGRDARGRLYMPPDWTCIQRDHSRSWQIVRTMNVSLDRTC